MVGLITLRRWMPKDALARTVLGGAAGTVVLNVAAVILNLALVVLLSRLLGPTGYGAYASAFAWAFIFSFVAVLGLGPFVVRQVAAYHSFESWGLLRGVLRRANQSVAVASLLTMTAAAGIGWLVYHSQPDLLHAFWLALLLIPLIAFATLRQAALQGLGRIVLARVPETILAPALFTGLAAAAAIGLDDGFSAVWAVGMQVIAMLSALCLGVVLLRRHLPHQVRSAAHEYGGAAWRRSGLALVLFNILTAANAQVGTILLGAIGSAADAGVFNVAARATMFISFVTLAVTYPLMPIASRLYANGELERLQQIVVRTGRAVLVFALPAGVALVVAAPVILGVFGSGFAEGAWAMRILAVGEIVNVVTGFGAVVLLMSGRESDLTRCVAVGTILNLGLSAALIPQLGVEGAAIGTAAGFACSNILVTWLVWHRLAVWPAVVGGAWTRR